MRVRARGRRHHFIQRRAANSSSLAPDQIIRCTMLKKRQTSAALNRFHANNSRPKVLLEFWSKRASSELRSGDHVPGTRGTALHQGNSNGRVGICFPRLHQCSQDGRRRGEGPKPRRSAQRAPFPRWLSQMDRAGVLLRTGDEVAAAMTEAFGAPAREGAALSGCTLTCSDSMCENSGEDDGGESGPVSLF